MAEAANQKSTLDARFLEAVARLCLKNSEYDFVHGGHGGSFFDADELSSHAADSEEGKIAAEVLDKFADLIGERSQKDRFNTLVFMERDAGPVGLVGMRGDITQRCELPSVLARPAKRLLRSRLKGDLRAGDRVAILADVATTGRSIAEAAEVVWQKGATVAVALALYDREEGAGDYLSGLDIELEYLIPASQLERQCRS